MGRGSFLILITIDRNVISCPSYLFSLSTFSRLHRVLSLHSITRVQDVHPDPVLVRFLLSVPVLHFISFLYGGNYITIKVAFVEVDVALT